MIISDAFTNLLCADVDTQREIHHRQQYVQENQFIGRRLKWDYLELSLSACLCVHFMVRYNTLEELYAYNSLNKFKSFFYKCFRCYQNMCIVLGPSSIPLKSWNIVT